MRFNSIHNIFDVLFIALLTRCSILASDLKSKNLFDDESNDQNNANLISAKIAPTYQQAKSGMMTTGLGAGILEKEEKAYSTLTNRILLRIAKEKVCGPVGGTLAYSGKKIYLTSILGQQANGMNIVI